MCLQCAELAVKQAAQPIYPLDASDPFGVLMSQMEEEMQAIAEHYARTGDAALLTRARHSTNGDGFLGQLRTIVSTALTMLHSAHLLGISGTRLRAAVTLPACSTANVIWCVFLMA